MKFPPWAIKDHSLRPRYLAGIAALEVDPDGNLTKLAKAAGVNYDTMIWNLRNTVSSQMAVKICEAAKTSGIRPHWFTNPDWIKIDPDTGEILE